MKDCRLSISVEERHLQKLDEIVEAYNQVGGGSETRASIMRLLIDRAILPKIKEEK